MTDDDILVFEVTTASAAGAITGAPLLLLDIV